MIPDFLSIVLSDFHRFDLQVVNARCCLVLLSPQVGFAWNSIFSIVDLIAADPQAIAAERALHELEFYKTPLVPTRIRSRMPNALATSTSSSNITDMFSRRHSLILMGDHDRPSKRDKKAKGKKGKETNETKPYAGTTGIKKRLAKAKGVNEEAQTDAAPDQAVTVEAKTKAPASPKETAVPKVPVPPPEGKDTFSVAAFPSGGTSAQQSSLRVGRAPRSHLSRPNKKFSAAYDEEDDKATDETQRELEMLEEAAKKVPVFEIPAGFTFAKDVSCLPLSLLCFFPYFDPRYNPLNLCPSLRKSLLSLCCLSRYLRLLFQRLCLRLKAHLLRSNPLDLLFLALLPGLRFSVLLRLASANAAKAKSLHPVLQRSLRLTEFPISLLLAKFLLHSPPLQSLLL